MRKLLGIGLDCAPPRLLFDEFREELPNLSKLLAKSRYGKMRSTDPPITIPAWAAMMSGEEPGSLGIYGFRNRAPGTYQDVEISNSKKVEGDFVWDQLEKEGKKSILVGIPPSFPPYETECCVSGILAPDLESEFTHPPSLAEEIRNIAPDYEFDIEFRKEKKEEIKQDLFKMAEERYQIIEYLLKEKEWHFFMFVDIGVDRLQHAFWKDMDTIKEYYKLVDEKIGGLLEIVDDETAVMVVSDHGAKEMEGAFAINDWLEDQGLLKFKEAPEPRTSISEAEVDWKNTKVWGWGGYYARIFLNVKDREPQGIVSEDEYNKVRKEVESKIKEIQLPNGEKMDNTVFYPEQLYEETKGSVPDLMVYLDDLKYRSAGTVGYDNPFLEENDTGPDDAVHAKNGAFLFYNPFEQEQKEKDVSIYDIRGIIEDFLINDYE